MADKKSKSKPTLDPLPKSQGVVAVHIEQAYVFGSKRQQDRIERYGRMNRKILRSIGNDADHDGTVSKFARKQKRCRK
jgi:hypothetical protein